MKYTDPFQQLSCSAMEKQDGRKTVNVFSLHLFIALLNFSFTLVSVLLLSYNLRLLRTEVAAVKNDIEPLLSQRHRVVREYKSRAARQAESPVLEDAAPVENTTPFLNCTEVRN